MPDTKAGRELLHRLRKDGVLPLQRDAYIEAIERESAQQERERIRAAAEADELHMTIDTYDGKGQRVLAWDDLLAILADNSPSASAEPDGEPSDG